VFRLSISRIALLVSLFCCSLTLLAADPVSPRNANGSITKAIPQPDGKVIVVGSFSYIGPVERAGIARLKADGTLDPTFDPGSGANGAINLVALQSDGKVLITGAFTMVAGMARAGIARLNSDGKLDLSFDPGTGIGPTGEISDLFVDGSDKAVLAGHFDLFNGVTRHMLARLNLDGTVDPTFDAGKNFTAVGGGVGGWVKRIALYPDGQLIAIGFFQAGSSTYDLVRVAVDGTVDQSFLAKGVSIAAVAAQPDGRVLLGDGYVNGSSGGLARLNADGQTDITFNAGASFSTVIRVQQDGRILVLDGFGLRRLNYNGTDDPAFLRPQISGAGGRSLFRGMEVQGDGRTLIYGAFNRVNGVPRIGVARLLPNGSIDPTFVPDPSIIATGFVLNLSTRVAVGTGDHVLIGGFIVDGTSPKKLMIRGIGPSLASSAPGVPTPLADPRVSLRDSSGAAIAQNDNWRTTQIGGVITSNQASAIQSTGIAPKSDAESAMILTLAPGAYTAIVEGAGGGTALVEMYDLDGSTTTRVANISTRGDVATGDNVLICGAILGGTHPTEVLVRALGPSLTASGVTGALQDPTLTLHNANGFLVGSNEDWKDYDEVNIRSTEAAPTDNREAAILSVLQPGNYTAVVRGKNNTTGIALVEFYSL
jgi:uncharacterized delta-60 repeat protein